MRRFVACAVLMILAVTTNAQRGKPRKYPSLLWEITGPGLSKPSYLFGTMHVSNKLAFHLADSFYIGIRKADIVALETNPESWQEDMNDYASEQQPGDEFSRNVRPSHYLRSSTLRFFRYDKKLTASLASSPATINNLLYRSYGEADDFQEDTYLDMYIYQCGKRWGKKITGVESYARSMQLMAEAYRDAERDPLRRYNAGSDIDEYYSSARLQDAYRSGNLDWLDSIHKVNSFSAAFDEKFMYLRNDIQAASIDSILKTGQSLFVGVGAAHLPGHRGVIEWLRAKGYRLRPVKMGARDSQHKSQVEKIRVPVTFRTHTAPDGVYKVDVPGKFYRFDDENLTTSQEQYADMANGSYYTVSRIMTNAWMWGHSRERVGQVIDSLLYENIPGKIIKRSPLLKNGYKGFDITNRTRRGDLQRYNIFVTPFEIIIFKMSGNGEYINGAEAQRFFSSIQLKDYLPAGTAGGWKNFTPPGGGFSVSLPHLPFTGNDGSWIYDAEDRQNNTNYRVIRTDIHNYTFAEEDSFDLGLMNESFGASDFIDRQLTRHQTLHQGYAALDASFRDKQGKNYFTRFIIQGPHYYTLIAHGANDSPEIQRFFQSFRIESFQYGNTIARTDTSMKFTVSSPVFPKSKKIRAETASRSPLLPSDDNAAEFNDHFKNMLVKHDTTGEIVHVTMLKIPKYLQLPDSTNLSFGGELIDTLSRVIYRSEKRQPDSTLILELRHSDSLSSRLVWTKIFLKENRMYQLTTLTDTLTKPSAFIQNFFETFQPIPTSSGVNPFTGKSKEFFQDFTSSDSVTRKTARVGLMMLKLDSADLPELKKAIAYYNWSHAQYMEVKKQLIGKLAQIRTRAAVDYARELFFAAGDTMELQVSILNAMTRMKTAYAYSVFARLLVTETPVLESSNLSYDADYPMPYGSSDMDFMEPLTGDFMSDLGDSLQLTRTIIKDILPLINIDEYEQSIKYLLYEMLDSNMVKGQDYEPYYSRFLIEARQLARKHAAAQKQAQIDRATKLLENKPEDEYGGYSNQSKNSAQNSELAMLTRLLLPFWEKDTSVPRLARQLLATDDRGLQLTMLELMIRNRKPYPDTLLNYFAANEEHSYQLYQSLRDMNREDLFLAKYKNQLHLAKSELRATSEKTDSIVFLQRMEATIGKRTGYVYFFKQKGKRESNWKIATAGIFPKDTSLIDFPDEIRFRQPLLSRYLYTGPYGSDYGSSANRLKPDQPLQPQLDRILKRLVYKSRRSAANFYNDYEREENYEEEQDESGMLLRGPRY